MQRDKIARYIYEQSKKDMDRINRGIKEVEAKILELTASSEDLNENCKLITSKGIALINTVAIWVATQNFTCFANSWQFACHARMLPFGSRSGTSIKTAPHVSHLANKKLKVVLTRAALCAVGMMPIQYQAVLSTEEGIGKV